jgi:FkbM family methyltransferase
VAALRAWQPSFGGDELIVSYSQNAEDVRLWRIFRTIEEGFYVDVGAADPAVDSVTRLFYLRGWSGINIEPNPCFEALAEQRARDVNLHVAVGEAEGPVKFFFTYPYLGLSTVDPSAHAGIPEAIEKIDEVEVPQRRLDSILREHAAGRVIHFLKIDVEGSEREVLASVDWTASRPIVVVVESIEPWSTTPTHQGWESILLEAGYRFAAFDGINRFYVEGAYEHLIASLAYPISPLDRYVASSTHDLQARLDRALEELQSRSTSEEPDAVRSAPAPTPGTVLSTAAVPFRRVRRRLGRSSTR